MMSNPFRQTPARYSIPIFIARSQHLNAISKMPTRGTFKARLLSTPSYAVLSGGTG
jgi:hypothetical protein